MVLKRWAAAIMILMLLAAVGCGSTAKSGDKQSGGAGKSTAARITDVRDLLNKAEAAELMGEPVKEPEYRKDANNPLGQQILFFSTVKDNLPLRSIQLSLVQNEGMSSSLRSSAYSVKKLFEETKKNFPENTPVLGVGDQAFWTTAGLHILVGNYYLNINVGGGDQELAKRAAEKVLPRLR